MRKDSFRNLEADVDEIEAVGGNKPRAVYSITGVQLYQDATDEEIASLPKGIYIIGGKKGENIG